MSIPESIWLEVFSFLSVHDNLQLSLVSKLWLKLSRDNVLWKRYFWRDFHSSSNTGNYLTDCSWYDEYQCMINEAPSHLVETVTGHTDEILGLAFSQNGSLLASVSVDFQVILWRVNDSTLSIRKECSANLKLPTLGWKYHRNVYFNETATKLLIIGKINDQADGLITCDIIYQVDGSIIRQTLSWWDVTKSPVTNPEALQSIAHFQTLVGGFADMLLLCSRLPDSLIKTNQANHCDMSNSKLLVYRTRQKQTPLDCTGHQHEAIAFMRISKRLASEEPREPDSIIPTSGLVAGMTLALNGSILVANVCACNCTEPAQLIPGTKRRKLNKPEVILIDLQKMATLNTPLFAGHSNWEAERGYLLKYPHATKDWVVSGSSDNFAYLWSRKWGCLVTLSHFCGVDFGLFHPCMPNLLVTGCDDHKIRLWTSKTELTNRHRTFTKNLPIHETWKC